MSKPKPKSANRLIAGVVVSCLTSVVLLIVRISASDSARYIFLVWNMVLAIIPVLLAWWLVVRVRQYGWLSWKQLVLSLVWLSFLPNSFYLVTDFVHLSNNNEASLFFDVVMLASFMVNGLMLGYIAVYLVHKELIRRFSESTSYKIVALIFLICSFATYLGRFTRWNTWDILLQPAGLIFDVSDRVINPGQHGETYLATGILFIFLSSVYVVIWEATRLFSQD